MIERVVVLTAIAALFGCATSRSIARLTAAEATRLAECKAQSWQRRLSDYNRSAARYERADDAWWVNYSPKHTGGLVPYGFSIEVKDKTAEAIGRPAMRHTKSSNQPLQPLSSLKRLCRDAVDADEPRLHRASYENWQLQSGEVS